MGVVIKAARPFRGRKCYDDMVAAGVEGLLIASDKFDRHKPGANFVGAAHGWVRDRMYGHEIRLHRGPVSVTKSKRHFEAGANFARELADRTAKGESWSEVFEELRKRFGMTHHDAAAFLGTLTVASFDSDAVPEVAGETETEIDPQLFDVLVDVMSVLDDRSRTIVAGVELGGRSFKSFEPEMGVSRERIRQIYKAAMTRLRREIRRRGYEFGDF